VRNSISSPKAEHASSNGIPRLPSRSRQYDKDFSGTAKDLRRMNLQPQKLTLRQSSSWPNSSDA
jgi:hypothetical protein